MSAVSQLIQALSSPDASVRAGAAEKIAGLGAEAKAAVPALIRALDDSSFIVQLWAVRALAAIGPDAKAAVNKLVRTLDDEGLRLFSLNALGKIGPDAMPAIDKVKQIAAMSAIDEVSEAAAMAMYRIEGTARQATILLQALVTMGRDAKARMHAANDLGEIGEAEAIPALLRALEDPAGGVRREAANALGRLGAVAKDAVPALEQILNDPRDDGARLCAAEALWKIDRRPNGLSYLCQLISRTGTFRTGHPSEDEGPPREKDVPVRARAIRAIAAMGERAKPALPALIELLDEPSDELRTAVAEALMKIQPKFS